MPVRFISGVLLPPSARLCSDRSTSTETIRQQRDRTDVMASLALPSVGDQR